MLKDDSGKEKLRADTKGYALYQQEKLSGLHSKSTLVLRIILVKMVIRFCNLQKIYFLIKTLNQ